MRLMVYLCRFRNSTLTLLSLLNMSRVLPTDLASDGGEVSVHGVVGGRRGGSIGGALVLGAVLTVRPLGLAPHLAHGVPGHRVTLVVGHALVGHPWHRCAILRERERERLNYCLYFN